MKLPTLILAAALLYPAAAAAQTTAPATPAPAADTPNIRVGVTIFADYTVFQEPKIEDADGNEVTYSAFQIGRTYLNVTGNLSRTISFRVTPEVRRETGVGSSLNGSYVFRLKQAWLQWNLDDHVSPGSYARFGMQPNPWFEFYEPVYRYRFQGTIFEEREGFMLSADVGASFRYSLPRDFGDIQTGFYNGEGYSFAEVNDQKAFMIRGTIRPVPGHAVLKGLRATGFFNKDAYVKHADRQRAIGAVTFEHPYLHAGFHVLSTKDQPSATARAVDGRGWSMFITPRPGKGVEGLVRIDRFEPDQDVPARVRKRTIAGVAYWFPTQGNLTTALMLDVDHATFGGFAPARPTDRRIALHALLNF